MLRFKVLFLAFLSTSALAFDFKASAAGVDANKESMENMNLHMYEREITERDVSSVIQDNDGFGGSGSILISQSSGMTQRKWDEIYTNMRGSCFQSQRNHPANSVLTDGQIAAFCSCVASETANSLSSNDVDYIERTGDPGPMLSASRSAYARCAS
ncbi:hypothetical protein [Marinobacter sp. NFXS9]|uniref:hypothetical protein n=1 Tax=Marinobacter sp. NFXS9 TaxID=2818433 RepID=UPI0032DFB441